MPQFSNYELDENKRDAKILKALRPDGVVNQSEEVLERLEHGMTGQSTVLPVARNKDGSLSKTSKTLRKDEFKTISEFVAKKMKNIGIDILKGEADVSPYEMGDRSGCDYCPYKGVCGFDEKIPGYEYRKLGKVGKEEALAKMREEAETWEQYLQKNNNK